MVYKKNTSVEHNQRVRSNSSYAVQQLDRMSVSFNHPANPHYAAFQSVLKLQETQGCVIRRGRGAVASDITFKF